jgi:hypothetical protein
MLRILFVKEMVGNVAADDRTGGQSDAKTGSPNGERSCPFITGEGVRNDRKSGREQKCSTKALKGARGV